jgi:hypothetical protein
MPARLDRPLKGRAAGRIQRSTDAHQTYRGVVGLVLQYRSQHIGAGRYSPPVCIGTKSKVRLGDPDPAKVSEGETVAEPWNEQNRTGIDGGPLSERGRGNIARMLDIAAWHERQLCLVAVEDGLVGFGARASI